MRIRTFTAESMRAALDQIRRELGDDAVILSTRKSKNGNIEVRAAAEDRDELLLSPEPADDRPARRAEPAGPLRQIIGAGPSANDSDHPFQERSRRAAPAPVLPDLTDQLAWHGAPLWFAQSVAGMASQLGSEAVAALGAALEQTVSFAPIQPVPETPIALFGAPGSGKSAYIAKLAARSLVAGHRAAVILVLQDESHCAAATGLAHAVGAEVARVTDQTNITELTLAALRAQRTVFLDMGGFPHHDDENMRLLAKAASLAKAEPIAVLPADGHPSELEEAALAYASLGVKRCVISRLDIARRRLSAASAAAQAGLRLAQFSLSPRLSGGLAPATAQRLARMILEIEPEKKAAKSVFDRSSA